jgi:hypothetical protein
LPLNCRSRVGKRLTPAISPAEIPALPPKPAFANIGGNPVTC